MAKGGRPKAPLVLSDEEYMALQRLAMRSNTMRALALRARIVLECATGKDNTQVAKELGVSPVMVGRWRRRFVQSRMEGLAGSPGSGRSPPLRGGDRGIVVYHPFRVDPLCPWSGVIRPTIGRASWTHLGSRRACRPA
jgi:hypothetical protein